MFRHQSAIAALVMAIATTPRILYAVDAKPPAASTAALAAIAGQQQMLELPVRVLDADGQPVPNAKVFPWALRSSQGHGPWSKDADDCAKAPPKEVATDANGEAIILYPRLRDVAEQIQTIGVSLQVDHPEFAYPDDLHIEVPLEHKGPHEIKLTPGVAVVVRPQIENPPSTPGELVALWSDGRSWRPGAAAENLPEGSLKIPALPPGKNSVMIVSLDGDRATHFSKIVDFEVVAGQSATVDVTLRPAARVTGVLSDNVPRPIKNGRIKVETLPPSAGDYNRVMWFSWAPVEPDGTFTVEAWPQGEPMQLIALCDGYIAGNGEKPGVVKEAHGSYLRPQVFEQLDGPVEVAMTPLQTCIARAVDEDDKPVAGVDVASCPNVGWWNHGSQIYCRSLVRGERMLRDRDYIAAEDKQLSKPFWATTNAQGEARLELPIGKESLVTLSDVYELPVFLGRREVRVEMTVDKPTNATLRLQPRGTDKLGEWDKLAGVVFGCSTREGRRICALPGVQEKMEEFTRRFREAKDQQDPQLLSDAYAAVADAFTGVGDLEQATLWRGKAAEQARKAASK